MILPFLEKRFLGIDFGSINIKIVEGKVDKTRLEITNFGIIPIIDFKKVTNSSYIFEENLVSILNEFFKETKIVSRNAFFNVTAPYAFSASFFVPNIPERNLAQVIRFESQKQIPLSLEEIEIEYRYLSTETEGQIKQWLIFLSAVPKSYLKKLENISGLAKLKFSGYGLEYLNLEPYFWRKPGTFIVVDFGHSYSTLHLIREGRVVYANKLKLRMYDFLNSMMNLTQQPEEKVLDLILKKGFYFTPEERDFKNIVENFLQNSATTIQQEIEKIENSFFIKIEKIYWTGGICLLNGFKDEMIKRLSKYQQEILVPVNFVSGSKFQALNEKSTIFSQAIGLLMRKLLS